LEDVMRKQFVGFVAAALVLAAACSKSNAPAPGAPTASGAPSAASPSGSSSIAGTVVTALGTASVRPSGAALTVSIVGTSISGTVDAAGRFVLQNVPSGDLTLSFSGSGHDARVAISGVVDGEQIHLTINLGGNTADVDEDQRERADHGSEVEGRIVSVTCGASSSTIVVGHMMQITIIVPAGTPIHHGNTAVSCAQLTPGLRIHVKGTKNGTMVTATEILVQGDVPGQPQPPAANVVELKGTVSAIASRACGTNTVTFTVMSGSTATTVTTNASTKFEDTSCATLAVNDVVEVKGTPQGTGVLATSVEGEEKDDNEQNRVELKGVLGAWDASKCATGVTSTVGGAAFSTNAKTKFEDTTCTALKQGDTVEVSGTKQANGSVLATDVEKKN
jgi:uncharacterized protein DUF5666